MYFETLLENKYKDEKLDIYVDMDGVIADYSVGNLDYLNKRPLKTNIKLFRKLSKKENITLHILSICREDYQIQDKNTWLDKNAPFFKQRNIISKESNPNKSSKELKLDFLKSISQKSNIIFIDDDNDIIKYVYDNLKHISVYQDSSIID